MESRPATPAGLSRFLEMYELRLAARSLHQSEAHAPGTQELVVVLNGKKYTAANVAEMGKHLGYEPRQGDTTEVLDGVKARHALFMEGLRTINARREVFVDIRGEGVWLGCELIERWQGKALDVMRAAAEAGLIVLVAGPDVVRIAPSLLISLDEILEGLARLETALGKALS